jgi:hypothetical protein
VGLVDYAISEVRSFELFRGRLFLGWLEVGVAAGRVVGDVDDRVDL